MMSAIQEILVYVTLGTAIVFIVRKYFLPKRLISGNKVDKDCGHEDCGCK